MAVGKLWALVLIGLVPVLCLGSVEAAPGRPSSGRVTLVVQEQRFWNSAVHKSEFAPVPNTAHPGQCGVVQSPQALATPEPLLDEVDLNSRVSINFIVGTDGRVHSAFILESAVPHEDGTILDAVRYWRYRPALCDGVPTDAEAKVEFSSH